MVKHQRAPVVVQLVVDILRRYFGVAHSDGSIIANDNLPHS